MRRLLKWLAGFAVVSLAVFGAPAAMASNAPWHVVYSPSVGASAEVGEPVLITGYSYIGEGTPAHGVELTFDDGVTWAEADLYSNGSWRYLVTLTQSGDVTFRMRGWYNGALGDISPPRTFHVGAPGSLAPIGCPCTFRESEFPHDDFDPVPVELGVRFAVDRPGLLTGVTFRRGTYRGPVTIRVWGPGGTLLHEHIAPSAATGYTSAAISPPVPAQPGTDYVVSYYTPEGGYQSSEDFYTGTLFRAPYIVRAGAGVYRYGEGGGFPTDMWRHSNYTIYPSFVPQQG